MENIIFNELKEQGFDVKGSRFAVERGEKKS